MTMRMAEYNPGDERMQHGVSKFNFDFFPFIPDNIRTALVF